MKPPAEEKQATPAFSWVGWFDIWIFFSRRTVTLVFHLWLGAKSAPMLTHPNRYGQTTCPATRGRSLHTQSFCCTLTLTLLCFLEGKHKCECLVLRLPLKINATKCEVEKVLIMWGNLFPLMSWETKFRHVTLKGWWTNILQVRWVNRIKLKLRGQKKNI